MMNRGMFLQLGTAFAVAPSAARTDALASIENRYPGLRLGVYAVDLSNGKIVEHRGDRHFPLASTVKVPVVMAALHRVDLGKDRLDRVIRFSAGDLVPPYSPIAQKYPHGGALTLEQICRYTISQSDNTGVDLLFKELGGPHAVQRYVHEIGFPQFRIDRRERELPHNASLSDPRDTATPQAMADLLKQFWSGSFLRPATRKVLMNAMFATTTGDARLRAGVPKTWRVADKTGTYANVANDVGLLFPPHGSPIAIAVYAYGVPTDTGARAIAETAHFVST
jgi:beta-lactamase class A